MLWGNYPHIPALASMELERRQYHANKVRKIFIISLPTDSTISLECLTDLKCHLLRPLEMEGTLQGTGINKIDATLET